MVEATGARIADNDSLVLTRHRGMLLDEVLEGEFSQVMAAGSTCRSGWSIQIGRGNSVPRHTKTFDLNSRILFVSPVDDIPCRFVSIAIEYA